MENKPQIGMKRFSPVIRKSDYFVFRTDSMMVDVVICLFVLIIFSFFKNGINLYLNKEISLFQMFRPLLLPLVAGFSSIATELIWYLVVDYKSAISKVKSSYGLIPGLFIGLLAPIFSPFWVVVLGSVFAIVFGKLLFGGFGYNIVNPALIGHLFIILAFYGAISKNASIYEGVEAITSSTPLNNFKNNLTFSKDGIDVLLSKYSLKKLFFGFHPGCGAETSSFLILICGLFLSVRGTINWRIPLSYILTSFVLFLFLGLIKYKCFSLKLSLYQLFSGGLLFGAVFMATDPVTSPRTGEGKIIFGVGIGIINVILRYLSSMAEGTMISILLMNLFVFLIDENVAVAKVGTKKWQKVNIYVYTGIIYLFLIGYLFLRAGVGK